MALKIKVNNLTRKRRINACLVKKAVLYVLRAFRKNDAVVDVTFVSDRRIMALNKKYMHRAKATDVLSFVFESSPIPKGKALIGDIYISADRALSNAKRFKTSFEKELLLYAIHGVLHLLGFSDKTAKENARMQKLEKRFLSVLLSSPGVAVYN